MDKIELVVADIHSAVQPSEAFSLILQEKDGIRYVPVIIGMSEARAILVELNQSPTHRPLTHELYVALANHCGCDLTEVNIIHYAKGVYYADMLMLGRDNTTFHIDARPSDAIALALKTHAPVFMNRDIFELNCQEMPSGNHSEEEENILDDAIDSTLTQSDAFINQRISEMNTSELEDLLQGAVESEDFELAAQIQAELDHRKR